MAQFKINTITDQDLTSIVFSGKVLPADIINALKDLYEFETTSKVIWNFSDCDVTSLLYDDLSSFIDAAKGFAHRRVNGKTALVGSSDLAFGIGRMHITLADLERYPIPLQIFRSVDEALAWLNA